MYAFIRGATSALLMLAALKPAHALWPAPTKETNGSSFAQLSHTFSIVSGSGASLPADVKSYIAIASKLVETDDFGRLVVGRGEDDAEKIGKAGKITKLTVTLESGTKSTKTESTIRGVMEETDQPLEDWDESYSLSIPTSGTAALTASSSLGLVRGLQSFTQLVYTLASGTRYIVDAPISIEDSPAFKYRGLLLDTSRNFFPVEDLKRTLDSMSWTKLNVFHWHITDSHSWPLEVEAFPALSKKGAYSAKEIYSIADVKEVVDYGRQRGVATMVEIDTPGHTASIYESYPEYVACYDKTWQTFANEPPSGQLRFTEPKVQNFTNDIFASILPHFPAAYLSTGGDELNVPCYTDDPATNASLAKQNLTLEQALTRFVLSTHDTIRSKKKSPVVWEEMVLDHDVGASLGNDTVAISWISPASARAIVEKGFRLIHAPSDWFYLDCGAGEWINVDVFATSWCDPFKSWQLIYNFNPYENITTAQHDLVLGGQTALWTEQSDPSNLDPIVWPRAASAAEVFWTGSHLPTGAARNVSEAIGRLHDWRFRAVARGVKAIPIGPYWCALRPDRCNLDS